MFKTYRLFFLENIIHIKHVPRCYIILPFCCFIQNAEKTEKKFTRRPAAGAAGASAVVVLFVGHCFGTVVGAATFFWPPNDS